MAEICADTHAQVSGPFIWQQINNHMGDRNALTDTRNDSTSTL